MMLASTQVTLGCPSRFRLVCSTRPRVLWGKAALTILEAAFQPFRLAELPLSLREPVFVAIDAEETYRGSKSYLSRIGIATFDTRSLALAQDSSYFDPISSKLFIIKDHPGASARASSNLRYCYGEPEWVTSSEIEIILRQILTFKDDDGKPRNVVIVGHELKLDLRMLSRHLPRDLWPSLSFVKALICIEILAWDVLNFASKHISLEDLCRCLGIEAVLFHNAGNDALYTLQCMLGLFTCWKGEDLIWHSLMQPERQATEQQLSTWEMCVAEIRNISQQKKARIGYRPRPRVKGQRNLRRAKTEQPDVFEILDDGYEAVCAALEPLASCS